MQITMGRSVFYTLTEDDARRIHEERQRKHELGLAYGGNGAYAGQVYPFVVTRIFPGDLEHCNGQVLLDGNDTLWVTSVKEGTAPGTWFWPPRV